MANIKLPNNLVYYFGLYLIQREENGDATSELPWPGKSVKLNERTFKIL